MKPIIAYVRVNSEQQGRSGPAIEVCRLTLRHLRPETMFGQVGAEAGRGSDAWEFVFE